MIAYTLWELWIARNKTISQTVARSAAVMAHRALVAAVERWKAIESDSSHPIGETPEWISFWWRKVNFDGSWRGDQDGAGFVIKDHYARLIVAASFTLLNVSVPLAETIGAWNAIKMTVLRLGALKLWIEGDALILYMRSRIVQELKDMLAISWRHTCMTSNA